MIIMIRTSWSQETKEQLDHNGILCDGLKEFMLMFSFIEFQDDDDDVSSHDDLERSSKLNWKMLLM